VRHARTRPWGPDLSDARRWAVSGDASPYVRSVDLAIKGDRWWRPSGVAPVVSQAGGQQRGWWRSRCVFVGGLVRCNGDGAFSSKIVGCAKGSLAVLDWLSCVRDVNGTRKMLY
jgi:hypothetical protein